MRELDLPSEECNQMFTLLFEYHHVFVLEDGSMGKQTCSKLKLTWVMHHQKSAPTQNAISVSEKDEKDVRNGSNPALKITVVKPGSPSMEKG